MIRATYLEKVRKSEGRGCRDRVKSKPLILEIGKDTTKENVFTHQQLNGMFANYLLLTLHIWL